MQVNDNNKLLSQSLLENFFIEFLTAEGASKKTQKNYLYDVKNFFEWLTTHSEITNINQASLSRIKSHHIARYIHSLNQTQKSATTVRHLSAIKTFFQACIISAFITENPASTYSDTEHRIQREGLIYQLELKEWEIAQIKSGANSTSIDGDLHHVTEFIHWINHYKTIH